MVIIEEILILTVAISMTVAVTAFFFKNINDFLKEETKK